MKPIQRLGGMASLLLLVSLFSPAKATASEQLPSEGRLNASIDDRIAAVHDRLEEVGEDLAMGDRSSEKMNELISQWYDWGDWGDWGDWVDWGDWGDWVNWGDWADWGDWYNY